MADDPRISAKTAREGLARGLQLLQDPALPPQFIAAAEPIARAMGMLMQVERSDGRGASVRPNAEQALVAVRDALARLQSIATSHPAAEQAMTAVATSLQIVLALTRLPDAPAASPVASTQYQGPPGPPPPRFQAPPAPYQAQPAPPPQPQMQAPTAPHFQPPPPPATGFAPTRPAYAQQQQAASPYAGQQQQQQQQPQAQMPAPPSGGDSIPPPAGTIEAELGAHSPSNFYKTLSGNDIVDHGGIFVSTYNIPKIGQRITLRVHLPGGYHFDCAALVKWTREARDNPDAPPGFGAQFHGMTAEQRQLVQRYVRNREPLFYDDL